MPVVPATLEAAISGRPVDRPLLAPLFAALAAEVEQLDVRAFLGDAGKRSRLLADLARALRPDVLVVDSGSGWDVEAGGGVVDWSGGYPPALRALPPGGLRFGDAPVVLDLLARVRAVVPEPTALGVAVTGPAALARAGMSLGDAVQHVLAVVQAVAQGGASVVFVREDGAFAVDPAEYARVTTPLWGSLRFFRAVGVLHLRGAADGWAGVVSVPGQFLPVFDPDASPGLATALGSGSRAFGLALAPGAGVDVAGPLRAGGRCALVTNDDDLIGRVPVREVQAAVGRMRG
jgi:hypothetical protein